MLMHRTLKKIIVVYKISRVCDFVASFNHMAHHIYTMIPWVQEHDIFYILIYIIKSRKYKEDKKTHDFSSIFFFSPLLRKVNKKSRLPNTKDL